MAHYDCSSDQAGVELDTRQALRAGVTPRSGLGTLTRLRVGSPTGGNRPDITQLIPLVDAVPPIRGRRGRPRRRPRELFADRYYDRNSYRPQLRARGLTPRIAHRGVAHGSGLSQLRWVVERGSAWRHAFKRLRTRYERRADLHLGLMQLACALTGLRPNLLPPASVV